MINYFAEHMRIIFQRFISGYIADDKVCFIGSFKFIELLPGDKKGIWIMLPVFFGRQCKQVYEYTCFDQQLT